MGEQFWKYGETIFKLRVLSYQWQFCKFPANTSSTAGFCGENGERSWWDFVGRAWRGERYYMRVVCCRCSAFAMQSMLYGTQWVTEKWVFEFEIIVKIFSQTSIRVSHGFYWDRVVRYWDMRLSEEIWVMSVGIWMSDKPNKV